MCEWAFGPVFSKFATTNHNGIGMNEPYKLQLAINMKGLPLILWASFCGAVARCSANGACSMKSWGRTWPVSTALQPLRLRNLPYPGGAQSPGSRQGMRGGGRRPGHRLCGGGRQRHRCGNPGAFPSLKDRPDEALADLIRDNPAGQDDELTPFIIVRDIGDREAMPYVPVEAIPEPPPGLMKPRGIVPKRLTNQRENDIIFCRLAHRIEVAYASSTQTAFSGGSRIPAYCDGNRSLFSGSWAVSVPFPSRSV